MKDPQQHSQRKSQPAHEFFALVPLLSVALFALNNVVLKRTIPGFFTGKLSDVLFCFFMPLFISAVLARVCDLPACARVWIGIATTALAFIAVKTSAHASHALDQAILTLARPMGVHPAANRVDATDLVALPMLLVAWWFARTRAARALP